MSQASRTHNSAMMCALLACLISAFCAIPNTANASPKPEDDSQCATAQVSESLDGISRIVIHAGPSQLRVNGELNRTDLRVTTSLCHSRATPSVVAHRENDVLYLSVKRSDHGRRFLVGPSTSLLVNVSVPLDAKIEIVEMIGPTSIHHVSGVTIGGGLGALTISDISGDVNVRKGTGAMSITRVTGNADVSDGAGAMLLSHIDGNVRVIEDGAGQIAISTVGGSVLIESDGSGEIRIGRTIGDVLIKHDASGAIVGHEIGGAFRVEAKTSGSIVHTGVRGAVQIPSLQETAKRGPR